MAAIVPAAGRSERMGRPKLLLPIRGVSVIARVVGALREGGVERVVVVAPPLEVEGAASVIAEAERMGAEVVVPDGPTADMRASVELGLTALECGPTPTGVLLAPGDSPGLSASLVARVIARFWDDPSRIVVACHEGQRGHPVLLPWGLAIEMRSLPGGVGVNALLEKHAGAVLRLEVEDDGATADLDTPEDYRRWSP